MTVNQKAAFKLALPYKFKSSNDTDWIVAALLGLFLIIAIAGVAGS